MEVSQQDMANPFFGRFETAVLHKISSKIYCKLYEVRQKEQSPEITGCFLSNCLEYQCEILCVYVSFLSTLNGQEHRINVYNFTLKFQEVVEKISNNFRELLSLPQLV